MRKNKVTLRKKHYRKMKGGNMNTLEQAPVTIEQITPSTETTKINLQDTTKQIGETLKNTTIKAKNFLSNWFGIGQEQPVVPSQEQPVMQQVMPSQEQQPVILGGKRKKTLKNKINKNKKK